VSALAVGRLYSFKILLIDKSQYAYSYLLGDIINIIVEVSMAVLSSRDLPCPRRAVVDHSNSSREKTSTVFTIGQP
jgi:hypothetical protein